MGSSLLHFAPGPWTRGDGSSNAKIPGPSPSCAVPVLGKRQKAVVAVPFPAWTSLGKVGSRGAKSPICSPDGQGAVSACSSAFLPVSDSRGNSQGKLCVRFALWSEKQEWDSPTPWIWLPGKWTWADWAPWQSPCPLHTLGFQCKKWGQWLGPLSWQWASPSLVPGLLASPCHLHCLTVKYRWWFESWWGQELGFRKFSPG